MNPTVTRQIIQVFKTLSERIAKLEKAKVLTIPVSYKDIARDVVKQELTADYLFSAASGWRVVNANGISPVNFGEMKKGEALLVGAQVRAVTGDSSVWAFSIVIYSSGTILRRFTAPSIPSGEARFTMIPFFFYGTNPDVRVELQVYTGTSTTISIRSGTYPERYTWLFVERMRVAGI